MLIVASSVPTANPIITPIIAVKFPKIFHPIAYFEVNPEPIRTPNAPIC
jgi:hypothetical protein